MNTSKDGNQPELRTAFINKLSEIITSVGANHPLRVAIDGVDTSGKTTLADELVAPIEKLGRLVIRASIDRFHRPRKERYQRGTYSPEGYYLDSFDHDALIKELLTPLGEDGNRFYKTAFFDFCTDTPIVARQLASPINAILLVDGVFLLRPELFNFWDLKIFLHIPFSEVLTRATIRDSELPGGEAGVGEKYKKRYIPGQKIYLDMVKPHTLADIVVDNTDYNNPKITTNKLN